jgi:hypothetical protein
MTTVEFDDYIPETSNSNPPQQNNNENYHIPENQQQQPQVQQMQQTQQTQQPLQIPQQQDLGYQNQNNNNTYFQQDPNFLQIQSPTQMFNPQQQFHSPQIIIPQQPQMQFQSPQMQFQSPTSQHMQQPFPTSQFIPQDQQIIQQQPQLTIIPSEMKDELRSLVELLTNSLKNEQFYSSLKTIDTYLKMYQKATEEKK